MSISATAKGIKPGVCTSTNRPTTPYDGMVIYETDTDRVAVWDGSSWVYKTNATAENSMAVMIQPTSVSGTGVSLSGGKVSFTSASTININGCFSSAYSNYYVVLTPKYGANSETVRIRFRSNETDNSSAYYTHAIYTTHTGGPSRNYNANEAQGYVGWVADISWNIQLEIHNPFASDYTSWTATANGIGTNTAVAGTLWGMHQVQSSFDGMTLFHTSPMTGSLRIYAYRESM